MTVQLSHKADFLVAELPNELTIFNVREVYQALQPFWQSDSLKLILDVASLEELDSAGVQLLLWLVSQIHAPAQLIVSGADNDAFARISALYALQWPQHFEQ
ncbi:STAS domain-containing protein [Rheinheimera sp.]|uniref:STAS domain-containing protein n=1 Tax=Rheinheimera sp. TaxID=1869214 RepID=UPI0027BA372D|nr:STAS domain-containing protein [Rheinheimera sp.]